MASCSSLKVPPEKCFPFKHGAPFFCATNSAIKRFTRLEEEIPSLLKDSKGKNVGRFDGVVASDKNIVSARFTQLTGLSPPLDLNLVLELATKLQHIPVLPCFSLMLAFKEPLSLIPAKDLSFKNSEILSWAHCDSTKPGRSTDSERWILQTMPTVLLPRLASKSYRVKVPLAILVNAL